MLRRLTPLVFLFALFAGCSGGGGSSIPIASSTAAPAATAKQRVTIAIRIPGPTTSGSSSIRRPLYISPNTNSAAIAVNGGAPTIADLAPNASDCTASGSSRTCTIAISAPIGNDTFTETTYKSTDGSGPVLSQNTTSATIVAGKPNTITLTLDGVVNSIALTLNPSSPPQGVPTSVPLVVNVDDASGASIIGPAPFANPITLTDSDSSGVTKLSQTTITSPNTASNITVSYSGGALPKGALFSATATDVLNSNVTTATLTPSISTALVDWPTYAYDAARDGFNPYSGAITPTTLPQLHLVWQKAIQGDQTQPIIATNVAGHQGLLIVGSYVNAQAYDAFTGGLVWQTTLPRQDVQGCGTGGISGTPYYDAALGSLFMAAGDGNGAPNHVVLYKLAVASGAITGQVDVTPNLEPGEANDSHAAVSYANGRLYVGMGSDCEGSSTSAYPSWRGSVVAVDPNSMNLVNTFYTTWGQGGNYGGGGVWAWGGVASDPSGNIYLAAGNGETATSIPLPIKPPFVAAPVEWSGYAEHLVKLSGDLTQVLGSDYPGFNYAIGCCDLDYTGVPVLYQPPLLQGNCGMLSATQGKGGTLVINRTDSVAEVETFKLSVPSAEAFYMGNPAYSPLTGLLYAAITSSGNGSSMMPPGLAAIGDCGSQISWQTSFGPDSTSFSGGDNPRSAPTVTAGGVVLIGTPCGSTAGGGCTAGGGGPANGGALWALDASSSSLLPIGGKPNFATAAPMRMPPTVDGKWVWLYDTSGNLYALTIDPSFAAITARPGHRVPPTFKVRGN